MAETNRQVILEARPTGMITDSTTSLVESAIPEIGAGEALIRVRYLSIDPTIRMWMDATPTYLPPIEVGAVVRSVASGEVVASNSSRYEVGQVVAGMMGWSDYAVADEGERMMASIPEGVEIPLAMNVLGVTGLTAHIGLMEIGGMKEGDTVVVSGAAGATGSMVGQIARLKGAGRVVGIAGGPEKCAQLVETYGFDAAIDYKAGGVTAALRDVCPNGIDVYFDNVGGEILDAALANLAFGGRVVICGAISEYNATGRPVGPSNYLQLIIKRGTMRGFVVSDHMELWGPARDDIVTWLLEGKIAHAEHIVDGLEHASDALNLLFTGGNTGKVLVKVS